ncbi:MAG: glycine cleavage system aminomethyltransferase GcvT [Nitratireductor sp.]|nr:glycine cleavage system aminomethyltransferase GcvT [Nitratireductor sp.]
MKKTPLHELHAESGSKFGPFAGYDMPLFYPLGIMKEHQHTRGHAGLFDISHMVHIDVSGPQAADLIARASPFDPASQDQGSCKYTFFLNENAGIIDDLIVTRLGDARFRIVANAGCAEKDIAHISKLAEEYDADIEVLECGFVALQGPEAEKVLCDAGIDVSQLVFMTAMEPESGWFVSRTGYTGEDGFEIALPVAETEAFARKLLSDERVELIGLGARDSLRLEAGLSLYGQDLDEETSPHEAGLIWAIPKELRSGGAYLGADAFARKFAEGRKRKRVGLKPKEAKPVRAGATLADSEGNEIGSITSGGFGPTVGGPVALGMISADAGENGIFADVRGKQVEMEIVPLPFAPHHYKK